MSKYRLIDKTNLLIYNIAVLWTQILYMATIYCEMLYEIL